MKQKKLFTIGFAPWRSNGLAEVALLLFSALFLFNSCEHAQAATASLQPIPRIVVADFSPFSSWKAALAERKTITAQKDKATQDVITLAYAVDELKTHLEMLGSPIALAKPGAAKGINVITVQLVPDTSPNRASLAPISFGSQSFRLTNRDGRITITAQTGIGALYGVYGFLEHLGFDWPHSESTIVPTAAAAKAALATLHDVKWVPGQEYRGFWVITPSRTDDKFLIWMARKKFNIGQPNSPELRKLLGIHGWGGGHHLIEEVFSKKRVFENHPEWFSRIRFLKRPVAASGAQFNPAFTSKGAADYFADQIVDRLESGDLKHFDILNIWQVDAFGRSFDEGWNAWWNGNVSDNILIFYSNVVDRISKHVASGRLSRRVIIAGASYRQTMVPPEYAENAKRLEGKPYLHLFYPIDRDWLPLAGNTNISARNQKIVSQINAWKSSAKLAYGVVDYHNMTRYCGLALTDYKNFANNYAALNKGGLALFGYMHVAGGDPGPLRLTYALSSRLGWQLQELQTPAMSEQASGRQVVDDYFNRRFKEHAPAWRRVYELQSSATTNANEMFGVDSSLHLLLVQKLAWEKPFYNRNQVARFLTGFQKGGDQLRPGRFYGTSDYVTKFIGIDESIRQVEQAISIGNAEKALTIDPIIKKNMETDLAWLNSILARYQVIAPLGQFMMTENGSKQRQIMRTNLLANIERLESFQQLECTLSTVDHKEFVRQYRQIAKSTL